MRSLVATIAALTAVALLVPIPTVYDLRPPDSLRLGANEPTLAAIYELRWGLFSYYVRSEATYFTDNRYESRVTNSGFRIDGIAKTVISLVVALGVGISALKPTLIVQASRRLTMRWSGP